MKALLSLDLLGLNYYTLAIVAGLAIVVSATSNQVRPSTNQVIEVLPVRGDVRTK